MVDQSLLSRAQSRLNEILSYTESSGQVGVIPDDMTFRQWCTIMAQNHGLMVDNRPWTLDDRPALIPIYDEVPTYREDAYQRVLVIQKSTQIGLTVWSVLAQIYMARKFAPMNTALFVPDQASASFMSTHRWMPIVRSVPAIFREMGTRGNPSNIMTRQLGTSLFRFLWTSGGMTTESFPADCVVLDEVQGMVASEIDKVRARLGDSDMQFTLMLSTPNNSGLDINEWYLRGHQAAWHVRCRHCLALTDPSDPAGIFPDRSIVFNGGQIKGAPDDDFCWICPECGQYIGDHMQEGEYVSQNPAADPRIRSFLLPRTISPRMTARDALVGWQRAKDGAQKKSFYNRVLARSYENADEIPVTLAHCAACVEEGRRLGVQWETTGERGAVYALGIDNMASFSTVLVLKRLPTGHVAVVHAENIYMDEPYDRCCELMDAFNITIAVTELLPNANSARVFSNRYNARRSGSVFIAGYGELRDAAMSWGDDPMNRSERHTDPADRTRWTVVLNQFRCMMSALYRVRDKEIVFADPALLEQNIQTETGEWRRTPILDVVFKAFTRTALVVTDDPETRKKRAKVVKLGADPHQSYALMLACVGLSRSFGGTSWILPEGPALKTPLAERMAERMPGLPMPVLRMVDDVPDGTCGRCSSMNKATGECVLRQLRVVASQPSCSLFDPIDSR